MTRKKPRYHTVYEEVSVEICLDDFSDEAILEEAIDRGFAVAAKTDGPKAAPRDDAVSVLQHLCCNRVDRGAAELRELIERFVPPHLLAALECLRDGRRDDAICELDRFIEPSPAATATTLATIKVAAGARVS